MTFLILMLLQIIAQFRTLQGKSEILLFDLKNLCLLELFINGLNNCHCIEHPC